MPYIDIPYIPQPKNSPKCGAACLSMLIKHYKKKKIAIDDIWENVKDVSPELNRDYCKTYKLGHYLQTHHFRCSIVRYSKLSKFLEFCISKGIAPVINHLSFENNDGGHFSVVKNISNNMVIINDPENRKQRSVPIGDLIAASKKTSPSQEIGGNAALVPTFMFPESNKKCPNCKNEIDDSFSKAANSRSVKIVAELCFGCDRFIEIYT